jgi:hypothetical protein
MAPYLLTCKPKPAGLHLSYYLSRPYFVTDPEFDLLDELYFVTPFRTLLQKTGLPAAELEDQLRTLLEQGLIRSYWPDPDTELAYETTSFGAIARDAAYLASKEGLLQHNTR